MKLHGRNRIIITGLLSNLEFGRDRPKWSLGSRPDVEIGAAEFDDQVMIQGDGDHNLPVLVAAKRMAALAAAYWLAVHGETKESIEQLSTVGESGLSDKDSLYQVTNEAIAAIRSRLGEFAGGLSVAESQDAGALSVAEQGGKLALADEGGQLSLVDEEARRKKLAARARQKR
jgi:hypothetical protein